MQRIIKFRAWDGERMIYRGLHDRNWYSADFGGGLVKMTHPDDQRILSTMQFTGLQDKDGNYIYEGDLVVFEDNSTIHEVKYFQGGFCLFVDDRCFVYNINPNVIKVIGNRISNPELLS